MANVLSENSRSLCPVQVVIIGSLRAGGVECRGEECNLLHLGAEVVHHRGGHGHEGSNSVEYLRSCHFGRDLPQRQGNTGVQSWNRGGSDRSDRLPVRCV